MAGTFFFLRIMGVARTLPSYACPRKKGANVECGRVAQPPGFLGGNVLLGEGGGMRGAERSGMK